MRRSYEILNGSSASTVVRGKEVHCLSAALGQFREGSGVVREVSQQPAQIYQGVRPLLRSEVRQRKAGVLGGLLEVAEALLSLIPGKEEI